MDCFRGHVIVRAPLDLPGLSPSTQMTTPMRSPCSHAPFGRVTKTCVSWLDCFQKLTHAAADGHFFDITMYEHSCSLDQTAPGTNLDSHIVFDVCFQAWVTSVFLMERLRPEAIDALAWSLILFLELTDKPWVRSPRHRWA